MYEPAVDLELIERQIAQLSERGMSGTKIVNRKTEALAGYAACVAAGAVFLPLNTAYTPTEVDYFLRDSGARLLIADAASEAAMSGKSSAARSYMDTLIATPSLWPERRQCAACCIAVSITWRVMSAISACSSANLMNRSG